MTTNSALRSAVRAAGFAAASLLFSLPALAGEIYSWRTDDGGYAFTDDAKAIPAHYRDQVATRANEGLGSYQRLTTPEAGSGADYASRLENRLEHLRALNRDLDAAHAPRLANTGPETLAVQTGKLNIGIPMDGAGEGPVVIEKIRFRHDDEMATRHNLVVRKGGKTLAIIKGDPLVSEINQAPAISEMIPES